MRRTALAPLLLVPVLATGCLHEPDADLESAYQPEVAAAPVVRRDVMVRWERSDGEAPVAVLAASPRDRLRLDPVPFRIGAGHGALGTIDLGPCRTVGLPAGYLAMRVTFRHDGHVAHAVVEGPLPPPQEALDCVAQQIEDATVPVFDGRDASLTKRFFVEPGGAEAEPEDTVVQKGGAPARRRALEGAGLSRR